MVNLDLTTIVGIIALAQAILLCFYLVVLYPKKDVSWLLVALLLVIVIGLGHDVLLHSRLALWVPHILGLGPFHTYLVGPLVLLLVMKLIAPERRISAWNLLHFTPFVWHQVSRWEILFQSGSAKKAILDKYFAQPESFIQAYQFTLEAFTSTIGFYGHRFAYLIFALVILKNSADSFTHALASRAMIRKPLIVILAAYCTGWLMLRLAMYSEWLAPGLINNISVINSIALSLLTIVLAIALFKYPVSEIFSAQSTRKYQKSELDKSTGQSLLSSIEQLIQSQQLYSQPDIKQSDIAKALGIAPQLLSQVINQETQVNFNDYINAYRIEHFKSLVADPVNQSMDIQTLALESGFSSKATFYRVFKNVVGETPVSYRHSVTAKHS